MKKTLILLMALAVVGCSTFRQADNAAVKEQRLSTDFKREGVRVTYTWGGEVEKIESFGNADVWRGKYEIVAEADAKDKMIKFLRGETVDTQRMTKVIAKSIERAQDNTLTKKNVEGAINTTDVEIEKSASQEENVNDNSALRKESINNAQEVVSTITVHSSGRLSAVYKERGGVIDNGKTYQVVYVWTPKQQKAARYITNIMDAR